MKFVFFSGVAWDSCLGGRTLHLAQELSHCHEVHFVEMPSLRNWRVGARRKENITVHTLPPKAERFAADIYAGILNRKIGLSDAIVIVSHPAWAYLVRKLDYRSLCYDYLDHINVHDPARRSFNRLAMADQMLLCQADLVFAVSGTLKEQLNLSKCHLLPNGVSGKMLEQAMPEMPMTKSIGFHGAMYEWVDYDLLETIADEFPEYQLRLTGPIRDERNLHRLRRKSNIALFPQFHFSELPRIIGNFTIGIIPFLENEVGLCSDPLKAYEYLALGRAVLSTAPSAVKTTAFRQVSGNCFCTMLRKMLSEIPQPEVCREAAREHTWNRTAERMIELIQEQG